MVLQHSNMQVTVISPKILDFTLVRNLQKPITEGTQSISSIYDDLISIYILAKKNNNNKTNNLGDLKILIPK